MTNWKISKEQIDKLNICKKINEIILIPKNTKKIIAIDALDTSFSIIYINNNMNYEGDEIILNNLSEFIKSINIMNNNADIKINDTKLSITDETGEIICNYNFAFSDLVNSVREIYDKTDDIITLIKSNKESSSFTFSQKDFDNIKKFSLINYNTLVFIKGKIVLFDNTGTNEISNKNTIEINKSEIENDIRVDIDINSFSKIKPGNYTCTYNNQFVLFEEIDGDNIFAVAANAK